jgi:hypothetical protein
MAPTGNKDGDPRGKIITPEMTRRPNRSLWSRRSRATPSRYLQESIEELRLRAVRPKRLGRVRGAPSHAHDGLDQAGRFLPRLSVYFQKEIGKKRENKRKSITLTLVISKSLAKLSSGQENCPPDRIRTDSSIALYYSTLGNKAIR